MGQNETTSRNKAKYSTTESITSRSHLKLASMSKIGYHKERLGAYMSGEVIFPITLELDLTNECTRTCPECPSTGATSRHSLNVEFLDRLFGCLEGHTTGLLLTGGEPTLSPLFAKALQNARQRGFIEIAVVTNGSLIDKPHVAEALLSHATTIRLSMYDWDGRSCEGIQRMLRRIESLRKRLDHEGSNLQIGISALTSKSRAGMLENLAVSAREAGAHWLYFHPLCTKWGLGCPEPADQDGVLTKIREIKEKNFKNLYVSVFAERYENTPLNFDGYHAAHFLLVVGADGKNYLGPEVKYQPQHVIADLEGRWRDDFLWERHRMARISAVKSRTYPALQSRHRGILYNHFIERLKLGKKTELKEIESASAAGFLFPHIL